MSTARRWTKWWWQDWQRDPALRMCSPAARGIWMDLLAIMFDAEPCGHLLVNGRQPTERQLAAVCGASVDELTSCLSELEEAGAFSRSKDGVIFNRRMVRDKAISDEASANGTEGGNPFLRRGSVPKSERVRPYRKSDSPEKTKRIIARSNGKCFWCGVKLRMSGQAGPDYCHIDHLKPVCDGGSNDESNLVAACAACNHARARKDWSHPSDPYLGVSVGLIRQDGNANSDLKHQEAEAEAEADIDSSLRSESVSASAPDEKPAVRVVGYSEPKAPKGCRLPDTWWPSDDLQQFARSNGCDPNKVAEAFCDYWRALPGARGVKLDWDATFRNWCRRDSERGGKLASAPRERPKSILAQQADRMEAEWLERQGMREMQR